MVGKLTIEAFRRLDDPMLEVTTSFLAAYAAYLAAEAAGVSGVLSVVTAGLLMGRAQHALLSSRSRLGAGAVWGFVEFILNSLVFSLIGLQLSHVLDADRRSRHGAAGSCSAWRCRPPSSSPASSGCFPASWLPRQVPQIRRLDPLPPLAACHHHLLGRDARRGQPGRGAGPALRGAGARPAGLPRLLAILATLVLQGTTLEWLIRRLGVELPPHDGGIDPDEAEGRRIIAAAALEEIERWLDDPLEGAIARDILPEYQDRAGHLTAPPRIAAPRRPSAPPAAGCGWRRWRRRASG